LSNRLASALVIGRALTAAPKRTLLRQMVAFSQTLPRQFNQPLPVMMAQLTPPTSCLQLVDNQLSILPELSHVQALAEAEIRQLADAVAAWHFWSPLGLCLRRSLLRYHFLRAAQVPVSIVFGARLKSSQEGGGIGGHAWLTLYGQPYYEHSGDYQGFAIMYVYPPDPRP
jgi:hypothetical protein